MTNLQYMQLNVLPCVVIMLWRHCMVEGTWIKNYIRSSAHDNPISLS